MLTRQPRSRLCRARCGRALVCSYPDQPATVLWSLHEVRGLAAPARLLLARRPRQSGGGKRIRDVRAKDRPRTRGIVSTRNASLARALRSFRRTSTHCAQRMQYPLLLMAQNEEFSVIDYCWGDLNKRARFGEKVALCVDAVQWRDPAYQQRGCIILAPLNRFVPLQIPPRERTHGLAVLTRLQRSVVNGIETGPATATMLGEKELCTVEKGAGQKGQRLRRCTERASAPGLDGKGGARRTFHGGPVEEGRKIK